MKTYLTWATIQCQLIQIFYLLLPLLLCRQHHHHHGVHYFCYVCVSVTFLLSFCLFTHFYCLYKCSYYYTNHDDVNHADVVWCVSYVILRFHHCGEYFCCTCHYYFVCFDNLCCTFLFPLHYLMKLYLCDICCLTYQTVLPCNDREDFVHTGSECTELIARLVLTSVACLTLPCVYYRHRHCNENDLCLTFICVHRCWGFSDLIDSISECKLKYIFMHYKSKQLTIVHKSIMAHTYIYKKYYKTVVFMQCIWIMCNNAIRK